MRTILITIGIALAAGIAIGYWVFVPHGAEKGQTRIGSCQPVPKDLLRTKAQDGRLAAKKVDREANTGALSSAAADDQDKEASSASPERLGIGRKSTEEHNVENEKSNKVSVDKKEEKPQTAREWFKLGLAFNDDSDQEAACYRKALELDPDFAPAHYQLGALYMRRAEFAAGERHLALFWDKASQAEKQEYDIHVYTNEQTLQDRLNQLRGRESDEKQDAASVPYHTVDSQIVVQVILDGNIKADMLLDTGASITVIADHVDRQGRFSDQGRVRLQTIAQKQVLARVVRVNSIQLGPVTRQGARVAVADIPALNDRGVDGILGMDVLQGRTIRIDRKRRQVVLE